MLLYQLILAAKQYTIHIICAGPGVITGVWDVST